MANSGYRRNKLRIVGNDFFIQLSETEKKSQKFFCTSFEPHTDILCFSGVLKHFRWKLTKNSHFVPKKIISQSS